MIFDPPQPDCACPTFKDAMRAELEQVELDLCSVHQADEIERRTAAASVADLERKIATDDETARTAVHGSAPDLPLNAPASDFARVMGAKVARFEASRAQPFQRFDGPDAA